MSSSTFPNNPLPPLWETFQTLQDALKMANRAIPSVHLRVTGKPECQSDLLKYQQHLLNRNRTLQTPGQANASELIEEAKQESQDLFILGLWATFERFLRSYLQHKGEALQQTVTPPVLAASLYQHFAKEVEYWRPTEILDFLKDSLFSTEDDRKLMGFAKQVLEYRDWVAHGKNSSKLPAVPAIDPKKVYACLDKIVTTLLMHYP